MKKCLLLIILLVIYIQSSGQSKSHVLVGQTGMNYTSFMVWVPRVCDISLKIKKIDPSNWTDSSQSYNTIGSNKYEFVRLHPSSEYEYLMTTSLGDSISGRVRLFDKIGKDLPLPTIKIAAGSCAYIDKKKSDTDLVVFNSILNDRPDLMLWLGDNIYLTDGEWQSPRSIEMAYGHIREIPQINNLISNVPNLAVWDDHDFGPNDAVGSFSGSSVSGNIFESMWQNPPSYVNSDPNLKCFSYSVGDISIFGLDNRTSRTLTDRKKPQMLSTKQIDWLVENLKFHKKSTYKIVMCGSQILNDARVFENFSNFKKERRYLLRQIIKNKIDGVLFLTGDRHHSELSMLERRGIKIWDVTSSPLTSRVSSGKKPEKNSYRISPEPFRRKGFVTLDFTGDNINERQCNVQFKDSKGLVYWNYQVSK